MSVELAMLQESQKQGKWGFSAELLTAGQDPLLTAQLPVYAARAWLVQLNAFRFKGGTLAAASGSPDNQTTQILKVRVDFGIDAARETVYVDYPFGGCTFPVHGAFVRVSLSGLPNALDTTVNPGRLPIIGGMMSPYVGARGAVSELGPTFTTKILSIASGAVALIDIPPRACAYRLYMLSPSFDPDLILVEQVAGGVMVSQSWDFADGLPGSAGIGETLGVRDSASTGHVYPTRQNIVPLTQAASLLRVTNQGAATTQYGIQFLLDLG